MSNKGFFQLISIGFGVMTVLLLISQMPAMGFSDSWTTVNTHILPLVLVIIFLGFIVYMVVHR